MKIEVPLVRFNLQCYIQVSIHCSIAKKNLLIVYVISLSYIFSHYVKRYQFDLGTALRNQSQTHGSPCKNGLWTIYTVM